MTALTRADRDVIGFHLAFAGLAALTLALPLGASTGWRVLALAVVYNLGLPALAVGRGHREAFALWGFLVPLSALQVFPDWFLADVLKILVFPDTGAPRLGAVPVFMAGLWTPALFPVLYAAGRAAVRGWVGGALMAAGAGLALFAGAEAVLWAVPIWEAQNVHQTAHVAWYVLAPEVLLSVAAWGAFAATRTRGWPARLAAAFAVMVFYLGALGFFYFVVERLWLRGG